MTLTCKCDGRAHPRLCHACAGRWQWFRIRCCLGCTDDGVPIRSAANVTAAREQLCGAWLQLRGAATITVRGLCKSDSSHARTAAWSKYKAEAPGELP
eukprot:366258-Chlamydomonas_euryale.AAC.8